MAADVWCRLCTGRRQTLHALAQQVLKDPYNFDFLTLSKDAREKELEAGLLEHLRKFLLELGVGFSFVGSQYLLEVGGEDFRIDLALLSSVQSRRLSQSPGFFSWRLLAVRRSGRLEAARAARHRSRIAGAEPKPSDPGFARRCEIPFQERVATIIGFSGNAADERSPRPRKTARFGTSPSWFVAQAPDPTAEIPGRAKRSSLRQLAVSPNSRARALICFIP